MSDRTTITRVQAVERALASKTNTPGTCQLWTRTQFGAPSAGDRDRDGDADAVDGWLSEPADKRHPGNRFPPAGVPVAWGGGAHGFGHRAISLGNGMIRSTDAGGRGVVATVSLDWPERHWGLRYLGWSDTISGLWIVHPMATPPKPPAPAAKPKTRGPHVDAAIHELRQAKGDGDRGVRIRAARLALDGIEYLP